MNGRRDLPRPRQGARRLEQHQRDDLPARQPARLRALGGRPGHGDVGLRALPAVLQADGDLPRPAADECRGDDGPLVLERGPATNPLFGAFFEAVQQAGYPLTDDVNGYRQEGFAPFDRNIHRGRRLSAARAYLHPVMDRPEPRRSRRARSSREILFDGTRAVGVEYRARRRGAPARSRPARSSCAAARSTRRSCCSSPASATPRELARARHRRRPRPARRRREPAGPPRGLHPVRLQAAGLDARRRCSCGDRPVDRLRVAVPRSGPGRDQPLRGRRLRPQQRRRRLPEPDVPLPADRDPLRRLGARRRATATRCTSARCTPTPAARCKITSTDPTRAPGAAVQLPVDRPGPARVGRGDPRRARASSTSRRSTPFNGGELSPGPAVETDERDPRLGGARTPRPRCTRRARAGWASTTMSVDRPG